MTPNDEHEARENLYRHVDLTGGVERSWHWFITSRR